MRARAACSEATGQMLLSSPQSITSSQVGTALQMQAADASAAAHLHISCSLAKTREQGGVIEMLEM